MQASGFTLPGWDIIFVSHGFQPVDMLIFIAVTCMLALKPGNDDITIFLRALIF
jgi:hypothetical protein